MTTISTKLNRLEGWQRKLLDLTMRNVMLNLHTSKTIVSLNESEPEKIVALLRENRIAEIIGKDKEERQEILKTLYRESRNAIYENGTNTLFVSLGTLQWYEPESTEARTAPLLFIPLEIVRRKAMTYEVRMLDEDPMLNVTLLEMLHRDYGASFPELTPMPMEQREPDTDDDTMNQHGIADPPNDFPHWRQIFSIITEHINAINEHQPAERQWQMPMHSFIGLFSFTKFLMWHDISVHEQEVRAHELLGNLSESCQLTNTEESAKAEDIEKSSPLSLMLPVDYDASQLVAVAEADKGKSFILHGPPGTGKSQTITNIIANAMFKGKRVLFVSEKKAALEVVQSRLESIGIAPFCLELHSNKAQKRNFFAQIHNSQLDLVKYPHEQVDFPTSYSAKAETLQEEIMLLQGLADAIHSKRGDEMSLYDYISEAGKINAEIRQLSKDEIADLSPADATGLLEVIRQLDTIEEILGHHPSSSPLLGLYPYSNTAESQAELESRLKVLIPAIEKARRKAQGILNRWFFKRTPCEILHHSKEWQELEELAMVDSNAADIDFIAKSAERWNRSTAGLRKWHHFAERFIHLQKSAPSAIKDYLSGRSGEATAQSFAKGFYDGKANAIIEQENHLRSFNGMLHEKELTTYRDSDHTFLEISRQVLCEEMRNRMRGMTLNNEELKELAILERRIYNKGRGTSLRQIINDSRHVLHRLFPCMLMSPLSVAQFLEMEPGLFDIVIFDEASQMETPDAIGAIARGRQTIIVGDPRQLPPTSFFTPGPSGDVDEENLDADSILEDALAIGMQSIYLTRHYRSRHESLIAFSNSMFYDGRLLTFPSVNNNIRKVTHIDPHGIYDYGKTRTNEIEAKAVVGYVIQRLETADGKTVPSIGIVTFSKAQSNLIEDLLTSAMSRNKAACKNLERCAEPIFVKNLESVQGDERDMIIFSVGYAPDKMGKASLNFGPLNQQGGERRLNVAITRAKEEMVVFSSLMPGHIPNDGGLSKGVMALRAFISYAIDGKLPELESKSHYHRDELVDQIAGRLRKEGCNVEVNVGRSDFRIDIAVADPYNPGAYILGIIVDGQNYSFLPTVRDREITIPAVLKGLGWNLQRIWALDWLENPDNVIKRILNRLSPLS